MIVGGEERKAHYLAIDCRTRMTASSWRFRRRRQKLSWKATFRPSPTSVGFPPRFCTTTRNWRWRGFWATAPGRRRGRSSELQSHYLFADKFGRPAKGNDKGKVEGLVGYARRNFLVPIPRVASWEELNQRLLEACQAAASTEATRPPGDDRGTL